MAARDRLPPWHERHRLPNGRDVLVRPVRPEDAAPLRAGFVLLGPDRLRARLAGDPEPGEGAIQRLTRLNPRTDFMLVAADPEPPGQSVIAALAHVHTDVAGHRGEFTVLVSPFVAGMGIGRYLLARLVKWSRSRGLDILQGDVSTEQVGLLAIAATLGFTSTQAAEPSLVRLSLHLPPA